MNEATQERDPKRDQIPGDMLRKGRVRKLVTRLSPEGKFMYWKSWVGRGEGPETCGYISAFRKWAATATVIKRGDDV